MSITIYLGDGPAQGYYDTEFTEPPETLQAVAAADGAAAVLDNPADLPLIGEQIHIYQRIGPSFTCARSGKRRGCHTSWHYSLMREPTFALVPDPDQEA